MIEWVRPVISAIGMVGMTIGFFIDKVPVEAYLPIVTAIILWWYKARDEHKVK